MEALLEEVLKKAKKASEEAEVYWESWEDTPVSFEANRLKMIESRETSGIALRLIKNGRIGFSSTTNLEDLDGLVERALDMAPLGPPALLELPSKTEYTAPDIYDSQVEKVSLDDMVHLGQSMIDEVRSRWPEVQCEARVTKSLGSLRILNSRGCDAFYTKTVFAMSIEGTLIRGTDMLYVSDDKASCRLDTDTGPLTATVMEQLELARETAPSVSGDLPVVFTPRGVAATLLSPLLAAFNGKSVVQGVSPLMDKLGKSIVDERFSLWDDPTVPFATGSQMCDDEGVPARRISLIRHGVATDFIYDLQTAAQAGAQSTGSASRSLGTLPAPSVSVVHIGEGDTAYEEMVRDIKEGLLVESLLGAGQGNIIGGDFKANVLLGYRISGGKIIGRVKDVMISGNVYTVLNSLNAIGNEAKWVGGSLKIPHLYCGSVSVASQG